MEIAPVLLVVFNRPDTTQLLFDTVRQAKPRQLFIAADGPRKYKTGEDVLCQQTRAIFHQIDWECDVKTLFRDENIGCRLGIPTAVDWFFTHVSEGIIFEDDCIPDPSFFTFCTELLDKYRHNTEVMHISGINFQSAKTQDSVASYYFSGFTYNWGWATWKRAWQYFDIDPRENMKHLTLEQPYFNNRTLLSIKQSIAGYLDGWDVQWLVAVRSQHGVAITPKVNLVRNIGFGYSATHTIRKPKWLDELVFGRIEKLIHPETIRIDREADEADEKMVYQQPWYMSAAEQIIWPVRFYIMKARHVLKL